MKLIGLLRVKNGMATIDEYLTRMSDLCDEVIVLDNGSTDGTEQRYVQYPKITTILHTEGYHEGRDSNILLEEARKKNSDWIIKLDSDEIPERNLTRAVVEHYMQSGYDRIDFRSYNFWFSRTLFRIDRSWFRYTLCPARCMYRNIPGTYYTNVQLHCSYFMDVPGRVLLSPYRIKHYSHLDVAEARRKFNLYRGLDSGRSYSDDDPDIKHTICLPFIELKNPTMNSCLIYAQHYVANALLALLNAKRKYLKGVRLFPA